MPARAVPRSIRFRESGALRRVFERVAASCIETGLAGGDSFSIDASLIKADVNKRKRAPGDAPIAWPKAEDASHAVRAYLEVLDAAQSDRKGPDSQSGGAGGGGRRGKSPKQISLTDPQATWIARKGITPSGLCQRHKSEALQSNLTNACGSLHIPKGRPRRESEFD